MKRCQRCGNNLNDSDMFCSVCGSKQPNNNQASQAFGKQQSQQNMKGHQQNMPQNRQHMVQPKKKQRPAPGEKKSKLLIVASILSSLIALSIIVVFIFFIFGSSENSENPKTEDGILETDEVALRTVEAWNSGTKQEIMDVSLPKEVQKSARVKTHDKDCSFEEAVDEYISEREDISVVSTKIREKHVASRENSKNRNYLQECREDMIDELGVDVGEIEAAIGISLRCEYSNGRTDGDGYLLYKVGGHWYCIDY